MLAAAPTLLELQSLIGDARSAAVTQLKQVAGFRQCCFAAVIIAINTIIHHPAQ
jgi:hypothetical protein